MAITAFAGAIGAILIGSSYAAGLGFVDSFKPSVVRDYIDTDVGNVMALIQRNTKRMLAYSSIAHAGYLLIGVLVGGEAGTGAVLFYLLSYTFMTIGAFTVVSVLARETSTL